MPMVLGRFRKIAVSNYYIIFVISVRPSVRMEQLVFHWTDFHEMSYFTIFRKSAVKIQILLKSDKNNVYFI